MKAREIYESVLIELNKYKAPSLLLSDYNYYINKGITQFVNKRYIQFELGEQLSDDLDALKVIDTEIVLTNTNDKFTGTIPSNYLHILNCSVKFEIVKKLNCNTIGDTFSKPAIKLQSNPSKRVDQNYYFKPSFKNPYFQRNGLVLTIKSGDFSYAKPIKAFIDYLKTPTLIELTEDQIESVSDTSQVLQFQDYVCREIIKEIVLLILEKNSDPRLQTNIPVNQISVNK